MSDVSPAIFFGHGNPMNALLKNEYSAAWAQIGASLPRPRAIVCVSAHWYQPGTAVTAMRQPRTIHDFGGFPRALYEVNYPAPGDPELAQHVLSVPSAPELLLPIIEVIPLQLFAYHIAVANGCDVDNPRNLVKSVVEE